MKIILSIIVFITFIYPRYRDTLKFSKMKEVYNQHKKLVGTIKQYENTEKDVPSYCETLYEVSSFIHFTNTNDYTNFEYIFHLTCFEIDQDNEKRYALVLNYPYVHGLIIVAIVDKDLNFQYYLKNGDPFKADYIEYLTNDLEVQQPVENFPWLDMVLGMGVQDISYDERILNIYTRDWVRVSSGGKRYIFKYKMSDDKIFRLKEIVYNNTDYSDQNLIIKKQWKKYKKELTIFNNPERFRSELRLIKIPDIKEKNSSIVSQVEKYLNSKKSKLGHRAYWLDEEYYSYDLNCDGKNELVLDYYMSSAKTIHYLAFFSIKETGIKFLYEIPIDYISPGSMTKLYSILSFDNKSKMLKVIRYYWEWEDVEKKKEILHEITIFKKSEVYLKTGRLNRISLKEKTIINLKL